MVNVSDQGDDRWTWNQIFEIANTNITVTMQDDAGTGTTVTSTSATGTTSSTTTGTSFIICRFGVYVTSSCESGPGLWSFFRNLAFWFYLSIACERAPDLWSFFCICCSELNGATPRERLHSPLNELDRTKHAPVQNQA